MEQQQAGNEEQTQAAIVNPFEENTWSETLPNAATTENNQSATESVEKTENQESQTSTQTTDDGRTFLKEKLGFDDWDVAKNEYEALKTKAQTPGEVVFENEVSKTIVEHLQKGDTAAVYDFLDKQSRLNKLTTGDVTIDNAAEIVKAAMQLKYADFTKDEIDYKFNKNFSLPKEPVQKDDELEEEFLERKNEWSVNADNAKRELLMEAKILRPELEKLKTELKLPQIAKTEAVAQQSTPEEIEKAAKFTESYLQNIETTIKNFEGFNVTYKEEGIEFTSTYVLSDDEKNAVTGKLKSLADSGYNSNALFAERWVNDDGTFKVAQMAKDIALLENEGKVNQKLVNDAVAKSMAEYRKQTSNVNVTGNSNSSLSTTANKDEPSRMAEFFFAQ